MDAQQVPEVNIVNIPPGFGVVRCVESGAACHCHIYEYEYHTKPHRAYSLDYVAVIPKVLHPIVYLGKLDFSFFGLRVSATADHARCWMGQILVEEMRQGRLLRSELLVSNQ